jgi:hypothetical protein
VARRDNKMKEVNKAMGLDLARNCGHKWKPRLDLT